MTTERKNGFYAVQFVEGQWCLAEFCSGVWTSITNGNDIPITVGDMFPDNDGSISNWFNEKIKKP